MDYLTPGWRIGSLAFLLCLASLSQAFTFDDYGEITTTNLNTSSKSGTYRYAKAYFGTQLSEDQHFKGVLHRAYPEDGCEKLRPPNFNFPLPADQSWVALIRRSDAKKDIRTCNFIEKVLNAQQSGYKAVIIYDFEPNQELRPMGSDNDTLKNMVFIPSVFVGNEDGLDMTSFSFPDIRHVMTSAEFEPYGMDEISPYKILIPMAFSFVGILLVAVIVMIVRWCQAINRRRRSRISKSQLKKLPLVKYKKEDQYDCCAICLDDYEEGEKVRLLPCSHTYHQKCIDPWLLKNKRTCPVCKRKVIPKPPRQRRQRRNSDSSESDDSDTEQTPQTERTPLLPPPAGRQEERLLGAVGGTTSYGSGLMDRPSAHMVDVDSEDGGLFQASYPPTRSDMMASNRRHRSHYRRDAQSSSSSSDGEGDSETDLRRSLLTQVSVTPQAYTGASLDLVSLHSRNNVPSSSPTIPHTLPANQNAAESQSHDQSADHTSVEIEVEYTGNTSRDDDEAPLLNNSTNHSMIV